jgi:hypothetical protein
MKGKKFASFLFLLTAGTVLFGDDGGWNNNFSIQGGSIYTEQENPDVALVKELLVFDGEKTQVWFLFENTSTKEVRVPCGFPVRYSIDGYLEGGIWYISQGKYGPDNVPALDWFETENLESDVDEYGDPLFVSLTTVPANKFNNSREFVSVYQASSDITFDIWQDEIPVKMEDVLVDRHCSEDGLSVTLHYRHELVFKPKSRSIVRVEYTQDLTDGVVGGIGGNAFRWEYVIGTGSTWKGPIGELYFMKPSDWYFDGDTIPPFTTAGEWELFRAKKYEPSPGDVFILTTSSTSSWEIYSFMDVEYGLIKQAMQTERPGGLPRTPGQRFVTGVKASSSLTDTIDVFTPAGVLKGAGFGPLSAFDGLPETAWCEGKKDDGIGEYLEFTLTRPVWGLEIYNGFNRLLLPDWVYDNGLFDSDIKDDKSGIKDYYTLNNAPGQLDITTTDGQVLYRIYPDLTRQLQTIPGVVLKPGTYRLVIGSVYKGTAWRDTCIGEVIFLEADTGSDLKEFYTEPFYMEPLLSLSGEEGGSER